MFLSDLNARDFADFEPSENIRKIDLRLSRGLPVEQILPALKKWRQLRHLTLSNRMEPSAPEIR
jgi:hypothetical protein